MDKLRYGVIGCGLMGREFASAAARWMHLAEDIPRPEIVAVADTNPAAMEWFEKNVPTVKLKTRDYQELLDCDEVDAVYCAVPHVLHEEIYTAIIRSKNYLMGEKPFGMDKKQNTAILKALDARPEVFCRCCSQFPFYPAMNLMEQWIGQKKFGRIIEVKAGFLHSSDMDTDKPINWKRTVEINGEYGCMGDLGMHVQHIPLRYGWVPYSVSAVLSDLVRERPDGKGGRAACKTYDNATLLCRTRDREGDEFPMTLETKRLAPGSTNNWYLQVYGMEASACFTTDDPGALHYLKSGAKEQAWSRINIGYKPQFRSITGGIFEFGFTDAILQMWASFMMEASGRTIAFGCARPEETAMSHSILTAALESQAGRMEKQIDYRG